MSNYEIHDDDDDQRVYEYFNTPNFESQCYDDEDLSEDSEERDNLSTEKDVNKVKVRKQDYKQKLAFEIYKDYVITDSRLVKYVNREEKIISWEKDKIQDVGDSILHTGEFHNESIETSVRIALAKGWTSIAVEGTEDYKKALLLEVAKHDLNVDYSSLSDELISMYENAVAFNRSEALMISELNLPGTAQQNRVSEFKSSLQNAISEHEHKKDAVLAKTIQNEQSNQIIEMKI